jgi:uncharacterized protein
MDDNTKYGLSEPDIRNVVLLLQKNSKITKIVLFGSRAKGNFHAGSDVDIAIIGDKLSFNDVLDASIEIEKLNLPYKFDLVIYDRIKEKALTQHIDRVGIVLFETNPENRDEFHVSLI